jgi:hypothetical protein
MIKKNSYWHGVIMGTTSTLHAGRPHISRYDRDGTLDYSLPFGRFSFITDQTPNQPTYYRIMIKKHGKWHWTIGGMLAGMGLGFLLATWIDLWCEGTQGHWLYFSFPMFACIMAGSIFNVIVLSQPDNTEQHVSG